VKKIWHLLIHISFRTLLFVVRVVPRPIMYFWAASLGSLGYALSKRYRGVGMRNLDIAYGDKLTVEQKKKIVKQVFRNFAKSTLVEFPGVSAFGKNDVLRSIDIEPGMVSRLKEYQARGKGIIAVSGHIGNFELAARRMVIEGFKFAVVARNDPNPVMTTLINAVRNSGGYEAMVLSQSSQIRPAGTYTRHFLACCPAPLLGPPRLRCARVPFSFPYSASATESITIVCFFTLRLTYTVLGTTKRTRSGS
jgi:KDO2-lipid IV(A) lauroyltransferase